MFINHVFLEIFSFFTDSRFFGCIYRFSLLRRRFDLYAGITADRTAAQCGTRR